MQFEHEGKIFYYFANFDVGMINIEKQVQYWLTGADEELLNAKVMIDNKRLVGGMFFCHLCIE